MTEIHHVYLVPGMFGFGRLAGVDYFHHVRRALTERFVANGAQIVTEIVPSPPTSSLRQRARILAKAVAHTVRDDTGPIHLIGHSTGGLDVRLVLSPSTNLGIDPAELRWTPRVRSAVSMNTPHYGTPLAGYFATVAGTRMLYALQSSHGRFPQHRRAFARSILETSIGYRRIRRPTRRRRQAHQSRHGRVPSRHRPRRTCRGSPLSPPSSYRPRWDYPDHAEAIDLLNAAAENDPRVRYGCLISAAPKPLQMKFVKRLFSPYAATTAAIFSTLYHVTAQRPKVYPYAEPSAEQRDHFRWCFGHPIDDNDNDGIVPTLSMLWGDSDLGRGSRSPGYPGTFPRR
ncbi:MAG: hypothetical protein QM784_04240 [Polyangiaceae bacterium]